MTIQEFYSAVGGDYNEVLSRLMNETIIRKFILKYENDDSFTMLKTALEQNDLPTAFRAAHTLKGVTASLGLGELNSVSSELTEVLRDSSNVDLPLAKSLFAKTEACYKQVIALVGEIK